MLFLFINKSVIPYITKDKTIEDKINKFFLYIIFFILRTEERFIKKFKKYPLVYTFRSKNYSLRGTVCFFSQGDCKAFRYG